MALPYRVPEELVLAITILEEAEDPRVAGIIEWWKQIDRLKGFEDTWDYLGRIEQLNEQLVECRRD